MPEHAGGLVPRINAEGAPRGVVEQVNEPAVVGLPEAVERLADQQVQVEFATQRAQFAAVPAVQDGLGNAERSTEAGHNSTHGCDLNLAGRITHQVNLPRADLPLDRDPPGVYRDARGLER